MGSESSPCFLDRQSPLAMILSFFPDIPVVLSGRKFVTALDPSSPLLLLCKHFLIVCSLPVSMFGIFNPRINPFNLRIVVLLVWGSILDGRTWRKNHFVIIVLCQRDLMDFTSWPRSSSLTKILCSIHDQGWQVSVSFSSSPYMLNMGSISSGPAFKVARSLWAFVFSSRVIPALCKASG